MIPDVNHVIPWDGTVYPIKSWNSDHNLESAVKYSVVWYFIELANRIGTSKTEDYVKKIGFGNTDISGGKTPFWLDGNLRISTAEQVDFLTKLYLEKLPFSARTMQKVKRILLIEKQNSYRLYGKTGWATSGGLNLGWVVGWVERKDDAYFFALNIERSPEVDSPDFGKARIDITREVLRPLGVLN